MVEPRFDKVKIVMSSGASSQMCVPQSSHCQGEAT